MVDIFLIMFVLIFNLSLLITLLGRNKKGASVLPEKKKSTTTKSFKTDQTASDNTTKEADILKKYSPKNNSTYKEQTTTELKAEFKENEIISESLEEIIQDEDDHHNTNIQWVIAEVEKSQETRFNVDNWQQAIVVSEVLGKPKAFQ